MDGAHIRPGEVPFHPGTIRYLEENDAWSEEASARNADLVERGETLRSGWQDFLQDPDPDNLSAEWEAWKESNAPVD
jgi:hypothetical protein